MGARLAGIMRRLADYSDALAKEGKLSAPGRERAAAPRAFPQMKVAGASELDGGGARAEIDLASFMPPSQRLRELQQSKLAAAQGATPTTASTTTATATAASEVGDPQARAVRALVEARVEYVLARPWLLLLVLGAVPLAKLAPRLPVLAAPLRELQARVEQSVRGPAPVGTGTQGKQGKQGKKGHAATAAASEGQTPAPSTPLRGIGPSGAISPVPYLGGPSTPQEGREEGDGWLDHTTITPRRDGHTPTKVAPRPTSPAPQRAYVGVFSSTNNPPLSTQPRITRLTQCERPFDGRGVFSFIGTLGGTQPFQVLPLCVPPRPTPPRSVPPHPASPRRAVSPIMHTHAHAPHPGRAEPAPIGCGESDRVRRDRRRRRCRPRA